jgi:hypothetical protein
MAGGIKTRGAVARPSGRNSTPAMAYTQITRIPRRRCSMRFRNLPIIVKGIAQA